MIKREGMRVCKEILEGKNRQWKLEGMKSRNGEGGKEMTTNIT